MTRAQRHVYICGASLQSQKRLIDMGLLADLPMDHFVDTREEALQLAVDALPSTA